MSKAIEARIEALVAPIVSCADLFLESVTVTRGKEPLVRVTVDLKEGAGSVDADSVLQVSREISAVMDEDDPIESAYTLEVSTPGAERKLETARHFSRCIGHLVEIKTEAGERLKGRVVSSDDQSVTLSIPGKKGKPERETTVALDKITKAHSRIDFGSLGK